MDIYSKFCPACSASITMVAKMYGPDQTAMCANKHTFLTSAAIDKPVDASGDAVEHLSEARHRHAKEKMAFKPEKVKQKKLKLEASTRLVESKKWVQDVETKHHTPEGLFSKSAAAIAEGIKAQHPELKEAMSALNFFYNRKGKNRTTADDTKWEAAKKKLRDLYGAKEED